MSLESYHIEFIFLDGNYRISQGAEEAMYCRRGTEAVKRGSKAAQKELHREEKVEAEALFRGLLPQLVDTLNKYILGIVTQARDPHRIGAYKASRTS